MKGLIAAGERSPARMARAWAATRRCYQNTNSAKKMQSFYPAKVATAWQ